ncbi:MAG: TolC family protein, partial [Planctomycetaceae bacterium]|nr:TolC family protein [Planctomycetaceae bacterium]
MRELIALRMLLVFCTFALAGCTRTQYRISADKEVAGLVAEKSSDPRWAYPGWTIDMDPRSRFFDPTNPDCPPMPEDDPAAHQFMHYIDGKRGWPRWHENGDRYELENPEWVKLLPTYVPMTPRNEVLLNVDSAMKLGQVHSPDYRQQIETLYLSALDVSAERFRFDTQFFGGAGLGFTHQGRNRVPAVGEQNILALGTQNFSNLGGTNTQATRRLATGGELLVGFANSMVWQFAGPDQYSNISILNFNFVQPLLRLGGRAVALERLTIAERNLLGNLRAMQRYRQGFYTNVVIGELGVTGPQRRGGFFGGTGLEGFSGQGNGGFGEVGGATNFGRAGFGTTNAAGGGGGSGAGFAGGGAGNVGGFLGLLQNSQQIRNSQDSLNLQQRTLQLLEANLDAGLIDIVQVDQFRQNIQTERATLLQSEMSLENNLDTYKRQTLGLPPALAMSLDDRLIRQFQFIDPEMTRYQNVVADFVEALGDVPLKPAESDVRAAIERFAMLRVDAQPRLLQTQDDLRKLDAVVATREQLLIDPARRAKFAADREKLALDFKTLDDRYQLGAAELDALKLKVTPQNAAKALEELVGLASSLSGLITELSLVQARARLETVTIEPIELRPEQALEIARGNRLDWMNNRATLVDTWRLITFNASALKSNLQVTLSGDVLTTGNNPLNFNGTTGVMRAGLRFDAPFTRLLERNNYRQVLIDYQQDRRTLIRFEDNLSQTLRQSLRNLQQLRENLDIQRDAVAIAVRRVDKTREDLNEPPPPVQPGQPTVQLGPTAALNLLT